MRHHVDTQRDAPQPVNSRLRQGRALPDVNRAIERIHRWRILPSNAALPLAQRHAAICTALQHIEVGVVLRFAHAHRQRHARARVQGLRDVLRVAQRRRGLQIDDAGNRLAALLQVPHQMLNHRQLGSRVTGQLGRPQIGHQCTGGAGYVCNDCIIGGYHYGINRQASPSLLD